VDALVFQAEEGRSRLR